MQKVKALYRLSRPFTTLTGALAVVLGGYVAGTGEWFNVFLAALATVLSASAANAWNDYLDIEIDRVNQPQRVLPAGLISPRAAWIFAIVLILMSIVVAAFISVEAFWLVCLANLVLFVYSLRLKSTVLMGNATVALISALSAIFGGVAAGNVRPTFWLAIIITSAIMGREVLKTLADYDGDLQEQCSTVSTSWGKPIARRIFRILLILTMLIMVLPLFFGVYEPIYGYVVFFGVIPVAIYVLFKVRSGATGPQLEKLSLLIKYDFLIWFVAVVLGSR